MYRAEKGNWSEVMKQSDGINNEGYMGKDNNNLYLSVQDNQYLKYYGFGYPFDLYINVGNDSTVEYTNLSENRKQTSVINLGSTSFNDYIAANCNSQQANCFVPVVINSTGGEWAYSNVAIVYEEDNQSRIINQESTNTSIYLLMKVQYWNESHWLDEAVIQNDTLARRIQPGLSNQLKLDYIWNANAWNTGLNKHGAGTYRVFITIIDENDVNLNNKVGMAINSTYEFTLLTDKSKFIIKNSTGGSVAWFGDSGNIVLKGKLEQNSNYQKTANDEFIIRNNEEDVLILDTVNGSLYIDGTLFENQTTLTPKEGSDDFIVQDHDGNVMLYVNESGHIFMKGALTQNGNP